MWCLLLMCFPLQNCGEFVCRVYDILRIIWQCAFRKLSRMCEHICCATVGSVSDMSLHYCKVMPSTDLRPQMRAWNPSRPHETSQDTLKKRYARSALPLGLKKSLIVQLGQPCRAFVFWMYERRGIPTRIIKQGIRAVFNEFNPAWRDNDLDCFDTTMQALMGLVQMPRQLRRQTCSDDKRC